MMEYVRMRDTAAESIYWVNPEHANPLGILHGGRMMDWLVSTASLCCVRVARGDVVLASLDNVFFINPVRIGDMVSVRAWVEYVGRSSIEVGVQASSENPLTGTRLLTTVSHMVFVATDSTGKPREVPYKIQPAQDETEIYEHARDRWDARRRMLSDRAEKANDTSEYALGSRQRMKVSRIVFDHDTVYGKYMFGGRLLEILDELTAAVASRHSRAIVVTGSMGSMTFYSPIKLGNILEFEAALNHVGKTSMEVGCKIIAEDPFTGSRRHASTVHFTFVHVDQNGRPKPAPPYQPQTENERRRWQEAEERRRLRKQHISQLSQLIGLHDRWLQGIG